jgi:HNH endonuclease
MSQPENPERSAYNRAHYRVVKLWGKARQYPCISCGSPARDWAYDGMDPTGEGVKWKYSIWPEFYMPMCHQCHLGRDRDVLGRFQDAPPTWRGAPCLHPDGCPKPIHQSGLCRMHYDRWRRYGSLGPVGMIGKRASLEQRFTNNVQIYGPLPRFSPQLGCCAVWTGYVHASGFGAIWSGHKLIYVHRYAWEKAYGPIPVGARINRICLNKLCVRVDHLSLTPGAGRGHRSSSSD